MTESASSTQPSPSSSYHTLDPDYLNSSISVETDQPSTNSSEKGSTSMPQGRATFPIIIAVIAIVAGALTGVGAFKLQAKSGGALGLPGGQAQPLSQVATGSVKAGDVFGVSDEKTFKDTAEGYLEKGGIEGEGSHKLLREGGASQTVYLTSSVTDLDKFEGMNVKVWGETNKGQKAAWLMDVGRVQVINPQGQAPATQE